MWSEASDACARSETGWATAFFSAWEPSTSAPPVWEPPIDIRDNRGRAVDHRGAAGVEAVAVEIIVLARRSL